MNVCRHLTIVSKLLLPIGISWWRDMRRDVERVEETSKMVPELMPGVVCGVIALAN